MHSAKKEEERERGMHDAPTNGGPSQATGDDWWRGQAVLAHIAQRAYGTHRDEHSVDCPDAATVQSK